jgi:cytochrome c peroxidase
MPSTAPTSSTSPWRRRAAVSAAALALGAGAVVVRLALASTSVGPSLSPQSLSPEKSNGGALASVPDPAAGSSPLDRAALGRTIFFDESLSDPPGTSCASCHDPARAFAGTHGAKNGVAQGSRPDHFARRTAPSVLYLRFIPRFAFKWEEDVPLPQPAGGFFWDGRSNSLAELARQPLLNPDEMNARDAAQVRDKLAASPYAGDFSREFPQGLDGTDTLDALGKAVEAFLLSDAMAPFSSKYDDVLRGRTSLSPQEAEGMKLFKDRAKGACDSCHTLQEASPHPERSLFTDYGFDVVGAPRNRKLPATAKPDSFDLGLCERRDHPHTNDDRLCGMFRTPSLRNVAVRQSYMHNGAFTNLRDVVAFYATRGTDPKRWYAGKAAYDDLPEKYRENVNTAVAPYDRGLGAKPRLDDAQIDAIVAFLQTLTDAQYR